MARKKPRKAKKTRRVFTREFKEEAVQLLLDGHSARSVAENVGISTNMLYRWRSEQIREAGPAAYPKYACPGEPEPLPRM